MARYKNAIISKDKNGVRYYRATILTTIPLKDSDQFVYPKVGDRFDTMAQKYYGDSNLWWIIAKANNISGGQIGLNPEKKIRIPIDIQSVLDSV